MEVCLGIISLLQRHLQTWLTHVPSPVLRPDSILSGRQYGCMIFLNKNASAAKTAGIRQHSPSRLCASPCKDMALWSGCLHPWSLSASLRSMQAVPKDCAPFLAAFFSMMSPPLSELSGKKIGKIHPYFPLFSILQVGQSERQMTLEGHPVPTPKLSQDSPSQSPPSDLVVPLP